MRCREEAARTVVRAPLPMSGKFEGPIDDLGVEAVGRDDHGIRGGFLLEQIQDRLDALVEETDGVDLDSDEPVVTPALGHQRSLWTAGFSSLGARPQTLVEERVRLCRR